MVFDRFLNPGSHEGEGNLADDMRTNSGLLSECASDEEYYYSPSSSADGHLNPDDVRPDTNGTHCHQHTIVPHETCQYSVGEAHNHTIDRPPQTDAPKICVEDFRAEGLCHDYFLQHPFSVLGMLIPQASLADLFSDPPDALESAFEVAQDVRTNDEKWDVDKESVRFLASVVAMERERDDRTRTDDADGGFRRLKLDEPVLACDPDLELSRLRKRNEAVLEVRGIEPFKIEIEKDEGIAWPTKLRDLSAEKDREAAADQKFDVEPDVAEYLRDLFAPKLMSSIEMTRAFIDSDKVRLMSDKTLDVADRL